MIVWGVLKILNYYKKNEIKNSFCKSINKPNSKILLLELQYEKLTMDIFSIYYVIKSILEIILNLTFRSVKVVIAGNPEHER